jgi:hypothetical protein
VRTLYSDYYFLNYFLLSLASIRIFWLYLLLEPRTHNTTNTLGVFDVDSLEIWGQLKLDSPHNQPHVDPKHLLLNNLGKLTKLIPYSLCEHHLSTPLYQTIENEDEKHHGDDEESLGLTKDEREDEQK